MLWNWARYAPPGRDPSDDAQPWETPALQPARSLRPSPRHTHRALGQRPAKPVIRSWLGSQ